MGGTFKCGIHKNVKKNWVIILGDMREKRKLSRVTPNSPTPSAFALPLSLEREYVDSPHYSILFACMGCASPMLKAKLWTRFLGSPIYLHTIIPIFQMIAVTRYIIFYLSVFDLRKPVIVGNC